MEEINALNDELVKTKEKADSIQKEKDAETQSLQDDIERLTKKSKEKESAVRKTLVWAFSRFAGCEMRKAKSSAVAVASEAGRPARSAGPTRPNTTHNTR